MRPRLPPREIGQVTGGRGGGRATTGGMDDDATGPGASPSSGGRTRGRLALVLFVALLLATTLGFTSTRPSEEPDTSSALAAAMGSEVSQLNQVVTTTSTAPPTTPATTALPITTTTEDPGPLPDPPPADPYAPTPQVILGTIEIPKLGVTGNLQEGITLTAINRGPGHWPGTPQPGGIGNMVVAGHRTTYSKPFARLDELVKGDKVVFRTPDGTFVYQVRGVIVVPAQNIGIATQAKGIHTATLFACHPRGSATHRIVAKLELLGPDGKPVDAESALPPVDFGSDPVTGSTLVVRNTGQTPAGSGDPFGGTAG
jgi:sortase A